MISLKTAILATLSYADVFHFPLTSEEIRHWLIGVEASKTDVESALVAMTGLHAGSDRIFYVLPGRTELAASRVNAMQTNDEKIRISRRIADLLQHIPTIRLIGITGSVAMGNASARDDIDLFFIVNHRTLWVSRFLVLLCVEILASRRRPDDMNVANKICLNMFMTDRGLCVPTDKQDLFSAHEVVQMRPLVDKGYAHRAFLHANAWVKGYMPNAWLTLTSSAHDQSLRQNAIPANRLFTWTERFIILFLSLFEGISGQVQLWYMKKRRTTEVISDTVLMFHPHDARVWVQREFRKKLLISNIPLDKVFSGQLK